jgi:hypothetical protein
MRMEVKLVSFLGPRAAMAVPSVIAPEKPRFLALDQLAAVARVGLFRRSKLAKFLFVQQAITPPSASYEHFETEVEATES